MIDEIEKAAAAAGVPARLIADIMTHTGCMAVEASGMLMRFQRNTKSENVALDARRFKHDMQGHEAPFVLNRARPLFGRRSAAALMPWIMNSSVDGQ